MGTEMPQGSHLSDRSWKGLDLVVLEVKNLQVRQFIADVRWQVHKVVEAHIQLHQ